MHEHAPFADRLQYGAAFDVSGTVGMLHDRMLSVSVRNSSASLFDQAADLSGLVLWCQTDRHCRFQATFKRFACYFTHLEYFIAVVCFVVLCL